MEKTIHIYFTYSMHNITNLYFFIRLSFWHENIGTNNSNDLGILYANDHQIICCIFIMYEGK